MYIYCKNEQEISSLLRFLEVKGYHWYDGPYEVTPTKINSSRVFEGNITIELYGKRLFMSGGETNKNHLSFKEFLKIINQV